MPDEINIDELLELESEEERSRKIQVGGGEVSPSSPLCTSLKIIAIVHMFTECSLDAGHWCDGFTCIHSFNPHKTLQSSR